MLLAMLEVLEVGAEGAGGVAAGGAQGAAAASQGAGGAGARLLAGIVAAPAGGASAPLAQRVWASVTAMFTPRGTRRRRGRTRRWCWTRRRWRC